VGGYPLMMFDLGHQVNLQNSYLVWVKNEDAEKAESLFKTNDHYVSNLHSYLTYHGIRSQIVNVRQVRR
jgi:hypothetical protein